MTTRITQEAHVAMCFFCMQDENTSMIISLQPLLSCRCSLTAHLDCWQYYMRHSAPEKRQCPRCGGSCMFVELPTEDEMHTLQRSIAQKGFLSYMHWCLRILFRRRTHKVVQFQEPERT